MVDAAEDERGSTILPGLEFQVAPLLEHLTCPVCMDVMRNTSTTVPCGHNFCGRCIRQALNLKRECPVCAFRWLDKYGKNGACVCLLYSSAFVSQAASVLLSSLPSLPVISTTLPVLDSLPFRSSQSAPSA